MLILTELFVGSGLMVGSSTVGLINPGACIIISSSTDSLTSIAILITNENISKLRIRYTKLRDWIKVITLLYEKTLKQSMIDKKMMKISLRRNKGFLSLYWKKIWNYEKY